MQLDESVPLNGGVNEEGKKDKYIQGALNCVSGKLVLKATMLSAVYDKHRGLN